MHRPFDISQNNGGLHVTVHHDAVERRFRGERQKLLNVCCEPLPEVKLCSREVEKMAANVSRLRAFGIVDDRVDKQDDVILVDGLEVCAVGRAEDGIGDVNADELRDAGRHCLFDPDQREANRVLAVCLVLSVVVRCNFGRDDCVWCARKCCYCFGFLKDVSSSDTDSGLHLCEHIWGFAGQAFHAVPQILKHFPFQNSLDLGDAN